MNANVRYHNHIASELQCYFVDSHVHLPRCHGVDAAYRDHPCLVPAVEGEDNRFLIQRYGRASIALGYHPRMACHAIDWESMADLLGSGGFAAIGECGLDKRLGNLPRQMEVFERQICLARDFDLPLIIHCVGHQDVLLALHRHYRFRGVLHAFHWRHLPPPLLTGDLFFGYCCRLPLTARAQTLFASLPLDRILVETDGDEHTGARWSDLIEAYGRLARMKGLPLPEAARQISDNYHRLLAAEAGFLR
ncbi:TatD family hydrolase [Desulfurispirillum indicum]|uniref:TatD family hydrolase n=1 Tax=Desulfurispirillum indicum TaxID=936456 RepID=UPI0018DE38DB|nr:TatD family hydrolase [Desulfurispirillum indicum]